MTPVDEKSSGLEKSATPSSSATAAFVAARPRLFGLAYRMLGSASEAEDVVQDAWIRWQGAEHATIADPLAFLVTTTTRLAINALQSARARRETYIGPWLPEPIDTSADPSLGAEREEALSLAILHLLEKLTPTERAAYVLREAFDYEYEAIASILSREEANVRQLVARARKHLAEERKAPVTGEAQRRLLETFIAASKQGDRAALESLFVADVVSLSDGGGLARHAARVPVLGRERVAQVIASFTTRLWGDVAIAWIEANGEPAALITRPGAEPIVATIDASAEGIRRIFWMMSPPKVDPFLAPKSVAGV